MFIDRIEKLKNLPLSNRSMVYLMWIYEVWSIISGIFISIYVYKLNNSLTDLILYNIFFFLWIFIWFVIFWWFLSILKREIKKIYYISYILFILSFSFIYFFNEISYSIFVFALFYGIWAWCFWLAVHTNELSNIKNNKRDFYSSAISTWNSLLKIIVPLFVSLVFFLWIYFNFDWYLFLFLLLPFIYIFSFFYIKNTWEYTPSSITKKDLKNFLNFKKYKFANLYIVFWWLYHAISSVSFAIIALLFLKNEINIWIFESFVSLLSVLAVMFLSTKRNEDNRLKIMFYSMIIISINLILFAINFTLIWYIIFSLVIIFIKPLYRVSEHVFDLKIMDSIKQWWADFFPAMIIRDSILSFSRLVFLTLSFVLLSYIEFDLIFVLKLFLVLEAIVFFFIRFSIHKFEKYES